MSAQMAELSALVGGDENAPQFLQEMLVLQMQAEGWRVQWSVAMQENEELRAQLYDTHNSLAAKGERGRRRSTGASCACRSRSQRTMRRRVGRRISRFPLVLPALTPRTPPLPRKATIVEQLSKYREDDERAREAVEGRRGGTERMAAETEAETEAAAEWREKCDRVIEARNTWRPCCSRPRRQAPRRKKTPRRPRSQSAVSQLHRREVP